MNRKPLLVVAAVFAALLPGGSRPASGQNPPPDEDWRQISTEHFTITFPAGMEDLARRAAPIAERAHGLLAERFAATPGGPIQLLLTDHADITNGFATPVPYNTVTIFVRPPMDGGTISYFDDWLGLVITHELVHTFHLDMTGTLGKVIRKLVGRLPAGWPVFPSGATPTWMIEGLATYFESELTDAGRVKGTWQEMVMRAAALDGSFSTLDQMEGGSPVWPGGHRPYVYGARYLEHMAEVNGEATLGDFARSAAGQWVPYRINAAARNAFGTSVSDSWDAWKTQTVDGYRSLAAALAESAPVTTGETVEGAGRMAMQAMVSPDGETLAFIRSDGVDAAQIRVSSPGGEDARRLTRINGVDGTLSWAPGGSLLFSQLEFTDRYRLTGDLYRAAPDGTVERVTRGRRLTYADAAPDGARAVAVQEGGGTNRLVLVDLATGDVAPLTDSDGGVHWAFPRWSPDGRRIAAVRWVTPGFMDIVVLDEEGAVTAEVTRDRAVDITPFWTPDGSAVIWSSDRTGIPNLFAATVPEEGEPRIRQVTNVLGGASHPSVDPLGRWIHFASYHADGWHIERIPFSPAEWFSPQPVSDRFSVAPATPDTVVVNASPAGKYRALPTLRPYYWSPLYVPAKTGNDQAGVEHDVFKPFIGLATAGSDLVGRHSFSLSARVSLDVQRSAGGFRYSYGGLGNPVLGMSLAQSYDASSRTLRVQFPDDSVREFFLVERERAAMLSASFVGRRYRSSTALYLSGGLVREDLTLRDPAGNDGPMLSNPEPQTTFTEMRATLSASNTQRRAMSFSREDGVRAYVTGRTRRVNGLESARRGVIGQDRGFMELTGEVSAYKSLGRLGFANHVLAARFSAGAGFGAGANQFHFDAGGAEGTRETVTGLGLFGGSSLLFPVRGYPADYRSGRTAWSASVEYRFPLFLIDRGPGLFPLFFDRIHGTVFADAGNAWGPTLGQRSYDNPQQLALASVGAELTVILAALYRGGASVRFGGGFPLREATEPVFYIRFANPF